MVLKPKKKGLSVKKALFVEGAIFLPFMVEVFCVESPPLVPIGS